MTTIVVWREAGHERHQARLAIMLLLMAHVQRLERVSVCPVQGLGVPFRRRSVNCRLNLEGD